MAAQQAGALISSYTNRSVTVQHKASGSSLASQVLTEVDELSQKIILNTLHPTLVQFNLGLLAEESEDNRSRFEKDYFWCIDPLDGTLSFIKQTPGYSVSIALVSRAGEPVIGVIYDPVRRTIYDATQHQGARRNGKSWRPSATDKSLSMIADRSFPDSPHYHEVRAGLKCIAAQAGWPGVETVMHGGAAMNACWVLENAPACYFKFPKPQNGGGSLWDFAAAACIFNESGAVATDIFGQPLDLNRADSTFMNHRGTLFASDQALAQQIIDLYRAVT